MADFFKAVKYLNRPMRNEVRKELRAIGKMFKEEAASRAAAHSTTIPSAIKVRTTRTSVDVYTSKSVPIAELNEHYGNAPNQRWRHPMYNHDWWGPKEGKQKAYPFLKPTWDAHKEEWFQLVVEGVTRAFKKGGFEIR